MAKAMLIMDMPDKCENCNQIKSLDRGINLYCGITMKPIGFEESYGMKGRQEWCPLREAPKKKGLFNQLPKYDTDTHYEQGYNACIDEILGGGE